MNANERESSVPDAARRPGNDREGRFRVCGAGIGFGLIAVFVTLPIWGLLGPVLISMLWKTSVPPSLTGLGQWLDLGFSIAVPVAVFAIVLRKVCIVRGHDVARDDAG